MTLESGDRLGPYEIRSLLGAGAMGEVYHARDTRLGRDVALKTLVPRLSTDPEAVARFALEARAVAALNHPAILALHDVGEHEGAAYVVTELLTGQTLRERLRTGPAPPRKALDYARQIADAIAAAHERGIVHRDLKPENVFLTPDGRIKILDFGIAQMSPQPAADTETRAADAQTIAGSTMGSLGYMAPEQLRGSASDHRADIFALGCILYELLTGRRPFTGATPAETVASLLQSDPPPLAEAMAPGPEGTMPERLEAVVRRCLEKDPAERFQSARDLAFALEMPLPARADAPSDVALRGASYRTAAIAAAFVGAAALVAAAVLFVRGPAQPGREGAPTARFGIPVSTTWSDTVSISPDGRYIAYTGGVAEPGAAGTSSALEGLGSGRLWLRPVDAIDAHPLSETTAALPVLFWSPDSRAVGYASGSTLIIRELPDGPPRALAELAAMPQGVAWGDRGELVVALPDGLYRLSAKGGEPRLLLRTEPERELWRGSPSFLPGGQVLFTVLKAGTGEDALETRIVDLEGRELGVVTTGAVGVAYADGHLVFGVGGRLYAQPFDAGRLTLDGDRLLIAESVAQDWRSGWLAARASNNGVVVFRRAPRDEVRFTLVDRTGRVLRTIGEPGSFTNFTVSPDEQHIVAARRDPLTGRRSLWHIDVARGITSLAVDAQDDEADDPTFTRDGAQIAYRRGSRLVIRTLAGGPERTLVNQEAYPDDFSPDGRHLFYGLPSANRFEQWTVDITDPAATPARLVGGVTLADETRVSPNGSWVAYHSNETGRAQVYVMRWPSTGEKWQLSQAGGVQPRWSADGVELFFLEPEGRLMVVRMPDSDPRQAAAPEALFSTGLWVSDALDQFAPQRNGFLIRVPVTAGADAAGVQVIVNWKTLAAAPAARAR